MFVPLYYATFFQKSLAFNLVDSGAACRHIRRLWQWCSDGDPCTSSTWVTGRWLEMQILTSPAPSLSPPPAPHPPAIESQFMYVGPSYLCIQKFSRRCFCKLYFGKLWYKGHIFISIKDNVCIHMNLKLAMIIFTENFCNLLLLKIFWKTWAQYWCSHSWQSSPTIKAH